MALIAVLTDFGIEDPFVGIMKGVILKRAPGAQIVDLTHAIPPQDIHLAAFYLQVSFPFFPEQTIFCCVVDPGVGTDRRAVAVETEQYFFVAPDNGILSYALTQQQIKTVVELNNPLYHLPYPSSTFHGRDIFAPVSAALAAGTPIQQLGDTVAAETLVSLPFPNPQKEGKKIRGAILAIDHFGNCISSIASAELPSGQNFRFSLKGKTIEGLSRTFGDVPIGSPVAYIGSFGYLEFGIRNGNFAQRYQIQVGDVVVAEWE